jgi:hypothetical protein
MRVVPTSETFGAQESASGLPSDFIVLLFQIGEFPTQLGTDLTILLLLLHLLQLLFQGLLLFDQGRAQLGGLLESALGLGEMRLEGALGLGGG